MSNQYSLFTMEPMKVEKPAITGTPKENVAQNLEPQNFPPAPKKQKKTAAPKKMPALAEKPQVSETAPKPRVAAKPQIESHPRTSTMDEIYKKLLAGLKKYFNDNRFKRAVVGLSGGVDSSLTLKIAVDALGADNVTALILPDLGITKQENIDHAKILCEFFKIEYHYQPINNFLVDYRTLPWKPEQSAQMNTKARIRMSLLYNYANSHPALVLGTSNKSELLLGYGTKYGDMAADVEVIGDLYKTEVIKLADHVGLPPEIVYKTPTAELSPDQTDEKELGAPYAELDKILIKRDLGLQGCVQHGLSLALVQAVFRRMEQNAHKSAPPVVIAIK